MSMEQTTAMMQVMARTIDEFFNDRPAERKTGFALLVFPFNAPEGQRVNWVSNSERKDMVLALKEIVARFEGQAEIVGHG